MTAIFSVGRDLPGGEVQYISIDSNASLLDADLVLFWPDIEEFENHAGSYNGKACLSETNSTAFVEAMAHWRRETREALRAGKHVLVFAIDKKQIWFYTGRKEFSGTGRSQKVTNIVSPGTNYDWLPFDVGKIQSANGRAINLAGGVGFLGPYWKDLAPLSEYQVYVEEPKGTPVLVTKSGDRIVGLIGAAGAGEGSLLLLPPLLWDEDELTGDDAEWNAAGVRLGKRVVAAIVGVAKALTAGASATPEPEWAKVPEYALAGEAVVRGAIVEAEAERKKLDEKIVSLGKELSVLGELRGLLFETGKPLETVVLRSLRSLGFEAVPYKDSGSEFDVVFSSEEGRLLGEVEGKDSKPINIEKLRQLEMNISEDFAREEVKEHAKGVLFGNAFRITTPAKRTDFFTEKCLVQAQRGGYALVRTPDLFPVVRYVEESRNQGYAKACRKAIVETTGAVVTFPSLPET